MRSNITIILNTHMPDVLGEGQIFSEPENWLFEAITETYIPLLKVLSSWNPEANPGKRIVISMTPCLVDQLLRCRERYLQYLEIMQKIAAFEVERTGTPGLFEKYEKWGSRFSDDELAKFGKTAASYLRRIQDAINFMSDHDIIAYLKQTAAQKPESIELWTSTPDHNFLPFFEDKTQEHFIRQGVDRFAQVFDREPDGFWLPECAFRPGIEKHLVNAGVRKTAMTPHAIGVYHPDIKSGFYQHKDLNILVHDHRVAMHLWKVPEDTLPANPVYREFYRDVGMDVTPEYFEHLGITLSEKQKKGVWTGIKYFACADADIELADKPVYDPDIAQGQTHVDAKAFVDILRDKCEHVYDRKSFIVAFDTELFGHWWHEGIQWLDNLLQQDLDANV